MSTNDEINKEEKVIGEKCAESKSCTLVSVQLFGTQRRATVKCADGTTRVAVGANTQEATENACKMCDEQSS